MKVAVILLNWNGKNDSIECLRALDSQTLDHTVLAIDNGSTDGFSDTVSKKFKNVILLQNKVNLGFAGGVNTGLRYAINHGFEYAALINNDARPESSWLSELAIQIGNDIGVTTGKLLKFDGTIDSTGECYSSWGLAFPRGRNQHDRGQYDTKNVVFGASGGASMYRLKIFEEIDLFDEDFFAYYEDVDISFRAQLAGWKVAYVPEAIAYHKIGATSSKMKGFTTYQTFKNLPWLFVKNVPGRLMLKMGPRFVVVYMLLFLSAVIKGKGIYALKGLGVSLYKMPKKIRQRRIIQRSRTVSIDYIDSLLYRGVPPSYKTLYKLLYFGRKSV